MARAPQASTPTTKAAAPVAGVVPANIWIEVSKVLATGAVAAIASVVVAYLTFSNQSRELDIKMVDVALSILSGEKGGVKSEVDDQKVFEEYRLARMFALRTLKKYSGVDISDTDMVAWAESGKIAFGAVPGNPFFKGISCVLEPTSEVEGVEGWSSNIYSCTTPSYSITEYSTPTRSTPSYTAPTYTDSAATESLMLSVICDWLRRQDLREDAEAAELLAGCPPAAPSAR